MKLSLLKIKMKIKNKKYMKKLYNYQLLLTRKQLAWKA